MYFRNFIAIGLIIGAALFFPSETFAKKDDPHQKSTIANSKITQVEKTIKSSKPLKVEKPVASKNNKHKNVVIPSQANKNAQEAVKASVKRAENAVKNTLPNNAKAKQGEKNRGTKKERKVPSKQDSKTNESEKPSTKPVHKQVSTQTGDTKQKQEKSDIPSMKDSNNFSTINRNGFLKNKPVIKKTSDTEKEELPSQQPINSNPIQAITTTNSSIIPGGSPSKDRTSLGQSSSSLLEKWVLLENCLNFKLKQIYFSRENVYNNQWINAPPSQPPKGAPIFLI